MNTKRILALVLTLSMVFSLALPGFASADELVEIIEGEPEVVEDASPAEELVENAANGADRTELDQGTDMVLIGSVNNTVMFNNDGNVPTNTTEEYTVTFMPNYGSFVNVNAEDLNKDGYYIVKVKSGDLVAEPEAAKEGHDFTGWYVYGTTEKYDFSQPVTGNLLLKAFYDAAKIRALGNTADRGTESFAAVYNDVGALVSNYPTLAEAIAAAENGYTVKLLQNVSVSAPIMISKSITLDGANFTITTSANRGIRIDTADVNVTVKNLTITGGTGMERAIQVDSEKDNVKLTIDNVTATATTYTVNICGGVDNLNLTVKGSTLTGWGVINLWGNSGTVTISGSTLVGINDKTYNAEGWNDFGVVVMEGDTTAQTTEHSFDYSVNISNSTIEARSTTGNTQSVLLHNKQSTTNSLVLDSCVIVMGDDCEFFHDNSTGSVTKIRDTYMKGTTTPPELTDKYSYSPKDDDNYYTINGPVAYLCNYDGSSLKVVASYGTLQKAFDAAEDEQWVYLIGDVTQDDGIKFDKSGATVVFYLAGHTLTVNTGTHTNNRAIRIDSGTLEVYNGSIVAVGSGTTSSDGTGCYGAFRVEANGKLVADNLELFNSRPWGLNVKVLGGEAELNNVTITSSYGGGIEVTEANLGTQSKTGKATLTDCTFTQSGYFDHCSTALSVSGGSELIVNSGDYTGEYALYVFSSGGVINVKDGTFKATSKNAIIAAIDTKTYPEYTGGLKIEGGKFTGTFNITSPAYAEISGGYFTADPVNYVVPTKDAVSSDLPDYNYKIADHTHVYDESTAKWEWYVVNGVWSAKVTVSCIKNDDTQTLTAAVENDTTKHELTATAAIGEQSFTATKTYTKTEYTVKLNDTPVGDYLYGAVASLTKDDNVYDWYIGGVKRAVGAKTFYFVVTDDTEVTTAEATSSYQTPEISATLTQKGTDGEYKTFWSLPEGAKVRSVKFYRGHTTAVKTESEAIELLKTKITPVDVNLFVRNGEYTFTINNMVPGKHQHALIEVAYTLSDGTIGTLQGYAHCVVQ